MSDAETPLSEEDYEAIEAAVMETARGRWFLKEYARRNRHSDTRLVLRAVNRLETRLTEQMQSQKEAEAMRAELVEMGTAIARTRREIAALKPESSQQGSLVNATDELEAIVLQTEKATQDILGTAEQIQEIAWTLRENNVDPALCDALDTHATDIYIACSFQDLTGQRSARVVSALQNLEKRINAMVDIWYLEEDELAEDDIAFAGSDDGLLNGPSDSGMRQDAVDVIIDDNAAFSTAEETRAHPHQRKERIRSVEQLNEEAADYDLAFLETRPTQGQGPMPGDAAETPAQGAEEGAEEDADAAGADAPQGDETDSGDVLAQAEAAHDARFRMAERQAARDRRQHRGAHEPGTGEAFEDADPDLLSDGQKAALFS